MTAPQPRATWFRRVSDGTSRWFRQSLPNRSDLVPYYLASVVLADTLVLFAAATATVGSGRAWLLLSGSADPTDGQHPWFAGPILGGLAIAGYLFLPTMIGLVVAAGVAQLSRNQRTAAGVLDNEIEKLIALSRYADDQAIDLRSGDLVTPSEPPASGGTRVGRG